MSLERWMTEDKQGRIIGPLCEQCFRSINPEWFHATPIRLSVEPGCFDTIQVPEGWRELAPEEKVESGDEFWYPPAHNWCQHYVGGTSLSTPKEFGFRYIREVGA